MRSSRNSTILASILLIALLLSGRAQTHTWTGADPSGYWSAPANWSPAGVPANPVFGPEGTVTTLNGMPFRISYVGGDGNDVTLTAPDSIVLSGMQRSLGTQSVFSYSASIGLRYAVERSATLSNWTAIRTDTANTNSMTVTDTAATNRMYFYRVRLWPNPP